ncbi:DUF3015 family protein [Helicobacter sp. 11S02596-1]|uniref:DUF3015 family protein n=1 Tax=Helicobacter sp. 11S02596-1 TaxID=1476194 RepID=UPI000BA5D78D|nr:DUF3015 family protein [Helicobacter sp. 11S02596-1]PAF45007.1 hypothetical protein BJI48_00080 [Helicobacter sp. 11S02596-1]
MKKLTLSLVLAGALASTAFAAANKSSGCGLGSMLIDGDSKLIHIIQATTNGTSANQTFAITSGTSGCSDTKLVLDERVQEFVAANMDNLSKDISRGAGESLDTLVELLAVADKEDFKARLQANYNAIYQDENAQMSDVLDNISTL